MDEVSERITLLALAKLAKDQYRELLAHRMLAQYLKGEGYLEVDGIIESARQSPELQGASEAFDEAIDSKLPPSDEERQNEALRKWLGSLPPTDLLN